MPPIYHSHKAARRMSEKNLQLRGIVKLQDVWLQIYWKRTSSHVLLRSFTNNVSFLYTLLQFRSIYFQASIFLLYLHVLIHAVSRTGLLKQRIAKSAFCVTPSIFSSLPPNRGASSWQHLQDCVHILIQLAVLTGTPCCYPA